FTDQKDVICGTIRIGATEAVGGRTLAICMKEFREKVPWKCCLLHRRRGEKDWENICSDMGLKTMPLNGWLLMNRTPRQKASMNIWVFVFIKGQNWMNREILIHFYI